MPSPFEGTELHFKQGEIFQIKPKVTFAAADLINVITSLNFENHYTDENMNALLTKNDTSVRTNLLPTM